MIFCKHGGEPSKFVFVTQIQQINVCTDLKILFLVNEEVFVNRTGYANIHLCTCDEYATCFGLTAYHPGYSYIVIHRTAALYTG
jgi:hypothetical protein